jgi:CheY-like chemotaxis protein
MARVLVADDDRDIREAVRAVLEDDGHEVSEASDGAAALLELRGRALSVVALVDLHLRGLDGLGVLRAVAADPALAGRHGYVLMTAFDFHRLSAADRGLLADLDVPLLGKPFDIDELLGVVARVARRVGAA